MLRALLVCLIASTCFAQPAKNFLPVDDYLQMWKISKQFTIEVAEKMPEDQYGFKASEPEMSFGTLMVHIAASLVIRFNQMTGAKTPYSLPELQNKKVSKAETIDLLVKSFDYVIDLLPKITTEQMDKKLKVDWRGRPEATGRQMMLNMFTHVAHHRAQAEVYLRLKGIAPPVYTF